MAESQNITSSLQENRLFPPDPAFAAQASIQSRDQYDQLYRQSIEQPEVFWANVASELHWFDRWKEVLQWKPPYAKWYVGAKTNLSYNCLDRQIESGRGQKTAIVWEGEPEAEAGRGGR